VGGVAQSLGDVLSNAASLAPNFLEDGTNRTPVRHLRSSKEVFFNSDPLEVDGLQ
jgi:hypothetical protein